MQNYILQISSCFCALSRDHIGRRKETVKLQFVGLISGGRLSDVLMMDVCLGG